MEVVVVKAHVDRQMTWGLVGAHEFGTINKHVNSLKNYRCTCTPFHTTVVYCFIEKWRAGQFPVSRWRCLSQINDSHLKFYQIFTLSEDLGQGCSGNWHWTRFPRMTLFSVLILHIVAFH
jgi:hypothetical protein